MAVLAAPNTSTACASSAAGMAAHRKIAQKKRHPPMCCRHGSAPFQDKWNVISLLICVCQYVIEAIPQRNGVPSYLIAESCRHPTPKIKGQQQQQFLAYTIVTKGSMSRSRPTQARKNLLLKYISASISLPSYPAARMCAFSSSSFAGFQA